MPGFMLDVQQSGLSAQVALNLNGIGAGGLTATGSTQATAYQLATPSNEFTTVAASTGAILPAPGGRVSAGDIVAVYNQGANALSVYPPVGYKIGLAATNAAVSVASGKSALFCARGDGNYFAFLSA